jgi:alpha-amylase
MSDFQLRLDTVVPETKVAKEIAVLHKMLEEKETKLKKYELELKTLQTKQKSVNRLTT